jgi:predicted RNA-binding Zn ribbon-like protein
MRYTDVMATTVRPMPVAALVDLVNGWGSVPRVEAGEQDLPLPSRAELVARLSLPARGRSTATDAELRRVADLTYPVFAAADDAERAEALNALLGRAGVRPALDASGARLRAGWLVEAQGETLLAAAATALLEQLSTHGPDRLGTCEGRRCADVFVDSSPAGHRRFCSLTCQNRARVAAFRRRRTAGAARTGRSEEAGR